MVIVISFSILAVLLTYLSSHNKFNQRSLFIVAFFLVTILQVIRYDYGPDYMEYLDEHAYYSGSWRDLLFFRQIGHGAFKDMGWVLIGKLFPGKYGFFCLIGLISIVQNYIYYILIRDYTALRDRWKAMAIYLFSTSFYVTAFSAIRQGFAVALCIGALLLVLKNKLLPAVAVAILAVGIHTSAFIILPFLFLAKFNLRRGRLYAVIIFVVAIVLFWSSRSVESIYEGVIGFFPLLSRNYGHYIELMAATGNSLGLGFLLNSLMYIILLYFVFFRFEEFTKEQKIFMLCVCVSYWLIPFSLWISGIISRLETYFTAFEIVVVPLVYSKIKNNVIRLGAEIVFTFMMMYGYYYFFFVTSWSSESYATFKTIFSAILE